MCERGPWRWGDSRLGQWGGICRFFFNIFFFYAFSRPFSRSSVLVCPPCGVTVTFAAGSAPASPFAVCLVCVDYICLGVFMMLLFSLFLLEFCPSFLEFLFAPFSTFSFPVWISL